MTHDRRNIRRGVTRGDIAHRVTVHAPLNAGKDTETEGSLVMNVDTSRDIRQRDDIDVVGRVRLGRFDRWRFH